MCNCINEIVENIKNKKGELSEVHKYERLKIEDVACDIEGWSAEGATLLIPFTILHKPIGRKTRTTLNVSARFCPFCGKEINKEG